MPINSRAKGKAGELELAALLREHGFEEAARGQQHRGGGDSPDVSGLPGVHIEAKRIAAFAGYKYVDQAERDSAGTKLLPVAFVRANRRKWLVMFDAQAFLRIWRKIHE